MFDRVKWAFSLYALRKGNPSVIIEKYGSNLLINSFQMAVLGNAYTMSSDMAMAKEYYFKAVEHLGQKADVNSVYIRTYCRWNLADIDGETLRSQELYSDLLTMHPSAHVARALPLGSSNIR